MNGLWSSAETVAATGELVAVAFTTPEALVEALGESQPWITLQAGRLAELLSRGGLARMSINPVLPPSSPRTWTPKLLQDSEATAPR